MNTPFRYPEPEVGSLAGIALEAAPNAMLIVGPGGKIVLANAQTERLFGYSREELLGRPVDMLVPERFREVHTRQCAEFFIRPEVRGMGSGRDLVGLRKDGSEVPIEIGLNPVAATEGTFVVASLIDITERKRAEMKLLQDSTRDPLTGLFNRRYMEETLERELHRCGRENLPLSVVFIDVDHFKRFNDAFGHAAGDEALREVGRLLQSGTRQGDVACRYGGEELVLILPGTGLEDVRRRAEELRLKAADLRMTGSPQGDGGITLSMGVALFPRHGSSAGAILGAADGALYRAKREGRDRVVVAE